MRSLILSGLVSASVAFFGNGAAAADIHAAPKIKAAPVAHAHVATRYQSSAAQYGFGQPRVDPAQIVNSLLRSPLVAPYVAQYARRGVWVTRGSGGGTYVPYDAPTYDPPSPPDTSIQDMLNNQAQQQAIDAMNQVNEMNATLAATAAQTAADDAAMTQQIMNNGGL